MTKYGTGKPSYAGTVSAVSIAVLRYQSGYKHGFSSAFLQKSPAPGINVWGCPAF